MSKPEKTVYGFTKLIKRFWPEIYKNRRLISSSFLLLLADIVLRLLEPWPLKFIFDKLIVNVSSHKDFDLGAIKSLSPMTLVFLSALAIVIIASLRALASYGNTVGFALAGNRIITNIRNDLYNHIQCLPLSFHTKSRSGELLTRIISDVGLLQDVIVTAALPLMGNLFALIGMILVMFFLNWQLALAAVTIFPIFLLIIFHRSRNIREASRRQRQTQSIMAASAAESVNAIKTVQALSLEGVFSKYFTYSSDKSLKEEIKVKRLSAGLERSVDSLIAVATSVVVLFGVRFVLQHRLTPGELLVFLAYLKNAFKPLGDFAKYSSRLSKASVSAERVLELMDLTPEVRDLPDAAPAPNFKGKIEFKNVDFIYEDNKPVLKGINFIVEPGRHIALVAPSGGGKTTLVNLILRLYDPVNGKVLIDGKDIRYYTLRSLRSQISMVLQDTLLFAASVRDNITYGASDFAEKDIQESACLARAHSFIEALPSGYDTVIGERGQTLSNGQRQRIAIARAAMRKSPILIFDEPTASLDKENAWEVNNALEKISQGRTAFFITHDLQLIRNIDIIIYLDNGRIEEIGTHDELVKNNGHYANLYLRRFNNDNGKINGTDAFTL